MGLVQMRARLGSQRLVSALIGSLPAAYYSLTPQAGLLDLSRALGFRDHFVAPLQVSDLERILGSREFLDLADRIDASSPRLIQLAAQPESVASVMRAVNLALDPGHVELDLSGSFASSPIRGDCAGSWICHYSRSWHSARQFCSDMAAPDVCSAGRIELLAKVHCIHDDN